MERKKCPANVLLCRLNKKERWKVIKNILFKLNPVFAIWLDCESIYNSLAEIKDEIDANDDNYRFELKEFNWNAVLPNNFQGVYNKRKVMTLAI